MNLPASLGPLGDIDVEADRVVIWGIDANGALSGTTQQSNAPLQIYMEGNIVLRQGSRTFFADRMFYDVPTQRATILNGELLTPVPQQQGPHQYMGLVRLRAAAIRQLDATHFAAQEGMFTTSLIEEPSYALESEEITFEDLQTPVIDPATGAPA